jgi:hypothetical protein
MESEGQDLQGHRQHSAMGEALDSKPPAQSSMQEYRKRYRKEHGEFLKNVTKEDVEGILDVIILPPSVDMMEIKGSDRQVAAAVERFYVNDGR